MAAHLVWQETKVASQERAKQKAQSPCVIWFTGLSGAGKSTLANALEVALFERGKHSYLLDGDNLRHGLNHDLGFSEADRTENIRRVGEVAALFVDAGLIVLAAFISPFQTDRASIKHLVGDERIVEVYLDTPLKVCEQRDPKGLYRKARKGEVKGFTGIDSPYEAPQSADIVINTGAVSVADGVAEILAYLDKHSFT